MLFIVVVVVVVYLWTIIPLLAYSYLGALEKYLTKLISEEEEIKVGGGEREEGKGCDWKKRANNEKPWDDHLEGV